MSLSKSPKSKSSELTKRSDPLKDWIWRRRLKALLWITVPVVGVAVLVEMWPFLSSLGPEPTRTLITPPAIEPSVQRFGRSSADQGGRQGQNPGGEGPWVEASFGELMDEAVFEINRARRMGARCGGRGLPPVPRVAISRTLEDVAAGQVMWMVESDDYAHETPDNPMGLTPQDRVRNAGYRGEFRGENLAWGQASPRQLVRWWLNSPSHCRTLMHPEANEIGLGVEVDPDTERGYVWVMVYGSR
jgi:uncharacterized protein YkwD